MKKTALCCALALCTGIASAQTSGFYGGASIGEAKVDIDDVSSDLAAITSGPGLTNISSSQDDTDTSWKFFVGYKLNENLAIEGGYADFGKFKTNAAGTLRGSIANVDGSAKSHAYFFDVVGILPLGDFSLFGKVGGAYTQSKADASASYNGVSANDSTKENEYVPKAGVGAEYNINKTIAVRAEFERYFNVGDADTTGESDVDVWSIGLKLGF